MRSNLKMIKMKLDMVIICPCYQNQKWQYQDLGTKHLIRVPISLTIANQNVWQSPYLYLLPEVTFSLFISQQRQQFNYTWLRLIKHGEWCLAPVPDTGALGLHPCDNRNKGLRWLHKSTSVFHPELVSKICVPLLYCKSNFPLNGT